MYSWCGSIFTEAETAKVNNAQFNGSVVQNKSSPRKYTLKISPTATSKELQQHSKRDKNISWKVSE